MSSVLLYVQDNDLQNYKVSNDSDSDDHYNHEDDMTMTVMLMIIKEANP